MYPKDVVLRISIIRIDSHFYIGMRCGIADFVWRGPHCPKLKILRFLFCPEGFQMVKIPRDQTDEKAFWYLGILTRSAIALEVDS